MLRSPSSVKLAVILLWGGYLCDSYIQSESGEKLWCCVVSCLVLAVNY